MPLTTVIAGLLKHDRLTQQQFFEEFKKRMLPICLRYVPKTEDAEEVFMDAMMRAFAAIGTLQTTTEAGVYTWLKRIMVNTSINFLRKRKTVFIVSEPQGMNVPVDAEPFSRMGLKEIKQLVDSMPKGYRTVFNLSVIDGYTHGEIAGILNIKPKTVSSQLIKATSWLKERMERADYRPQTTDYRPATTEYRRRTTGLSFENG